MKALHADCANCPLRDRPCVPSYIPHGGANLLVIGEAPGTQEIIERVPFVGPSGRVLDHALEYSGVDTRFVGKTNAVLCRPIGNEDAPEAAILACSARLDHDIARAGAKHIVTMGNAAVRALDLLANRESNGGILVRAGNTYDYHRSRASEYGEIFDLHNKVYKYTATVNPAYLIHSDSYVPNFLRHIQLAVYPRARNFDANAIRYAEMTPTTRDKIIAYLDSYDRGSPMAYDVETDHLQWYSTPAVPAADLLCLVFTLQDTRSVIIPAAMCNDPIVRASIYRWFDRYNVITHNGKFDQDVTAERLGIHFAIDDDTMLMHYSLYELGSHGLKELGTEYLGVPDYEDQLITSWFKANGMSKEEDRRYSALPKERLYQYAAIDGVVTLQLWRLFKPELAAKKLDTYPYTCVLIETGNALPAIEQEGIGIDREQLIYARAEFERELTTLIEQMNGIVMPLLESTPGYDTLRRLMSQRIKVGVAEPPDELPLFSTTTRKQRKPKKPKPIYETVLRYNPSSPTQTSAILYGLLGLKLNKRLIKPTNTNTGKEALEALPDHAFVRALRHYRRIHKMTTTYIASLDRRADINDIIHVDFRLTGTEIGRLSASNGDHGIPRPDDYYGAMIRSLFVAPYEDEVLIIADYSQAELRAFAYLARVEFLLTKYREGKDVHTETALMLEELGAAIFQGFRAAYELSKCAITPDEKDRAAKFIKRLRVLAKNINFGNIYQGGAEGISGMIGGAIPARVIREVLKVYDVLMPEAKQYAVNQYAYLLKHGYVKTVFNRHRRFYVISEQNKDEAKKAAVHMVVAGSAADLNNLSAARLVKQGIRVCHLVHDNIIARAKRDEAPQVAALMQETMISVGAEFMPDVPWIVDIDTLDKPGDPSYPTYPTRWVPRPNRDDYDSVGKLKAA